MSDCYTFEESELPLDRFRESSNENFVTLQELRRAQNQDGVNVETRTSSASQSPEPFPSSRTKKQLLAKVDRAKIYEGCRSSFNESFLVSQELDKVENGCEMPIDTGANVGLTLDQSQVNLSNSEKRSSHLNWDEVAQKVTAHCVTNLERVIAFFIWITNFKFGSVKNENNIHFEAGSPMDFVSRACTDKLFDSIFEKLCESCKVPLTRIEGYVKASKYRIGHKIQEEHKSNWFSVFVEGEWRFIDMNWCCVKVSGAGTGEWIKVTENLDLIPTENTEGKRVFVKDEFYFLTDPENFIFTHFPKDQDWQLLVKPITLQMFEELAYIRENKFVKMDITTVSHPKCVVKVPDNGVVSIIFKENGAIMTYSTSLYIHKKSLTDDENKITFRGEETSLKPFLILERIWSSDIIIKFTPPKPAKYLLQFLGSSSENATQREFIKYVIHCPKTRKEKKIVVLPDQIGDAPFGMDRVAASFNIAPIFPRGGHLKLVDGQAELSFTVEQDLEFEYELCGPDDSHDNIGHLLNWSENNSNHVVRVIVPDRGHLILLTRCRKKNSSDTFDQFGKYIVSADIGAEDVEEYPFQKSQQIGWKQTTFRTKPLSPHEKPFITCHQPGLNISWTTSDDSHLTGELLFVENTTTKLECEENLFVDYSTQNKCIFQILFPQMGHYELNINKHTRGRTNLQTIFTYFIRALGEPSNNQHPFPMVSQSFWHLGFKLFDPLTIFLRPLCDYKIIINQPANIPALNDEVANLQPRTEYEIIIEAPVEFPVKNLVLSDVKERICRFDKKDNNRWETHFTSGSDGIVSVSIDHSSVDRKNPCYEDLVKFCIVSQNEENELKKKNDENKDAFEEKKRRDLMRTIEKKEHEIEKTKAMKSLNDRQELEKEKQALAKQKLQQALKNTSSQKIRSCLNEYRSLIKNEDDLVAKAEECLQKLSLKEKLKKALETAYSQNKTKPLITLIDTIERSKSSWDIVPYPQNDINNGKELLKKLARYKKMTSDVLKLDNETILELRNYREPPQGLISIVQGTLLILGHYEKKTLKWIRCQFLLSGIQNKIKRFDENGKRCHPGLAARAKQLITISSVDKASFQSRAITSLYKWSNSTIDLIRVRVKSERFKPASIKEQKKILCITDQEEFDLDWENKRM